ncbi:MAG TPA: FixH family protein, partial [Candidatus Nitrosotenuis sp.]|nr:FixH family protein [Candidatus Nitrosotenuis sp.]
MPRVPLAAFLAALWLLAIAPAARAQEVQAGHYTLTVETRPAPPAVGQALLRVRVATHGSPVEGATVQAALDMPAMPRAHAATVKLQPTSPGTYEGRVDFAMAGEWQIVFSVEGSMGRGQGTLKVQVASGAASPPPAGRTLAAGPYALRLVLEPDPPVVGDNRLQVWVEARGQPVEDARVRLKMDMPGMPMALPEVLLTPSGGGGYSGTFTLSMAGLWQLDFSVEGSQGRGEGSLRLEAASGGAAASPSAPAGPYRLTLTTRPDPPVVGDLPARIEVHGAEGKPVEGARLFAGVEMPGMPARPRPLPAREVEPGVYQVTLPLSMEGLWKVTVEVEGPQGRQEQVFNLQVARGGPPPWLSHTGAALALALGAFLLWRMARGGRITAAGVLVLLLLLGVALLATWYAGRHRRPDTSMGMKMDMAAPDMGMSAADVNSAVPVALEEVRPGRLDETVTYSATVAPLVEETVYPRVEGWLAEAPFYAGDRVQAGQALARLESPDLESRLAVARAGTRVARLRREQARLAQARQSRMAEQALAEVEA